MRIEKKDLWFDNLPVIGRMSSRDAAAKLREIGEVDAAAALEQSKGRMRETFGVWDYFARKDRVWRHTAHAFGYISAIERGSDAIPIRHIGDIPPDEGLKNTRVKMTLDSLRIADYPGTGDHRILFDFYAQNQLHGIVEHVHFNSTYRVHDGERAAILGYPIFLGLNVGTTGIAFRCFTVNVKNDEDESMLDMMESDVFKAGLRLVNTVQPAIAPLTGLAVALTKSIASRHRNVPVQDFYLGLDFAKTATGARLAIGSYIAVQIPESFKHVWNWNDWVYYPAVGQVLNRADPEKLIPYNYVILSVNRYSE